MIGSFWFNSFSSAAPAADAAYELISTTILSSSAASVTFSGLGTSAAAYKHLQIRYVAKTSRTGAGEYLVMRFNSDNTLSNYKGHELGGNGTSMYSAPQDNSISRLGRASGTDTANAFGAGISDILDFANTSKNKTVRSLSGYKDTGSESVLTSFLWLSTTAITSITITTDLSNNILTGSRFSLYGLK